MAEVKFHTNIDCMKKFMLDISANFPSQPLVWDLVQVYSDSKIIVELIVVSRSWSFTRIYSEFGCSIIPQLHCELHIPNHRWQALEQFVAEMKTHNIV